MQLLANAGDAGRSGRDEEYTVVAG
uniref:Uncharacterized protein n=1 Tax=mine drainage metagenome TaxID=410659 RepID=E6Q0C9_9ZZZZ